MNKEQAKESRRKMRAAIGNALAYFDIYGLGVHIPEAAKAIMDATEIFHKDMKEAEDGQESTD